MSLAHKMLEIERLMEDEFAYAEKQATRASDILAASSRLYRLLLSNAPREQAEAECDKLLFLLNQRPPHP